jgi:CRP-like cAMP-binding protein
MPLTVKETLVQNNLPLSSKFMEVLNLLDDEDQHLLMFNSHLIKCKPGTVMYAEGDAQNNLLFLNKGKVKIFKKGASNKNQIIRLIKEGWFFGYRALLAEDNYYQATAQVFEEAEIISISKDIINQLILKSHELSMLFIHILAADLAKSNEHTVTLTQKHLRGRLANALLILEDTYGVERDGKTLSARMSRGDLAELANMNIANTSRVIGEFAQEGIVSVFRRTIAINDISALKHISEVG